MEVLLINIRQLFCQAQWVTGLQFACTCLRVWQIFGVTRNLVDEKDKLWRFQRLKGREFEKNPGITFIKILSIDTKRICCWHTERRVIYVLSFNVSLSVMTANGIVGNPFTLTTVWNAARDVKLKSVIIPQVLIFVHQLTTTRLYWMVLLRPVLGRLCVIGLTTRVTHRWDSCVQLIIRQVNVPEETIWWLLLSSAGAAAAKHLQKTLGRPYITKGWPEFSKLQNILKGMLHVRRYLTWLS